MSADLVIEDVTVRFSGLTAVDGLTTRFPGGSISGLIGPNGAGKTTLLNAVCGFAPIASGRVRLGEAVISDTPAGARAAQGIVRGFQTVRLLERETVLENVLVGCERAVQPSLAAQLLALPAQRRARSRDVEAACRVLADLDLSEDMERIVAHLPFASRRRTEIARLLVVSPSVLLLDEPAAGLDPTDRQALAAVLQRLHAQTGFTLILIEHDVELVSQLCSHVVALDRGRLAAEGPPQAVMSDAAVRRAYFGEAHA